MLSGRGRAGPPRRQAVLSCRAGWLRRAPCPRVSRPHPHCRRVGNDDRRAGGRGGADELGVVGERMERGGGSAGARVGAEGSERAVEDDAA
jgi:hypothetical protein